MISVSMGPECGHGVAGLSAQGLTSCWSCILFWSLRSTSKLIQVVGG